MSFITGLLFLASIVPLIRSDAAPEVTDSVPGTEYVATIETPNFVVGDDISGTIQFVAIANGSVQVNVDLQGLPSNGGPFLYHVHARPVPTDGNCTGTLLHLNPYNGVANATTPATFEVGDLSGKHGAIQGTSISTSYVDPYLSLNPNDPAYVGNLSVVVHAANNDRLACANITREASSDTISTAGSVNSSTNSSSNSTTSVSSKNSGYVNGVSGVVMGAIVAGLLI